MHIHTHAHTHRYSKRMKESPSANTGGNRKEPASTGGTAQGPSGGIEKPAGAIGDGKNKVGIEKIWEKRDKEKHDRSCCEMRENFW